MVKRLILSKIQEYKVICCGTSLERPLSNVRPPLFKDHLSSGCAYLGNV